MTGIIRDRQDQAPDDPGLERAGHVPGHPHLDRADIGRHRLSAAAVAAVAAAPPRHVVSVTADMVGDLAFQGGLRHALDQLLQQPTPARASQPVRAGTIAVGAAFVCSRRSAIQETERPSEEQRFGPDRVGGGGCRPVSWPYDAADRP